MNRPERTCVGCRGRSEKSQLLRLVWDALTAQVVVDHRQTAPGRGAYLHLEPDCLGLAIRRRAVGRALRVSRVDGAQLTGLLEPLTSGPPANAG